MSASVVQKEPWRTAFRSRYADLVAVRIPSPRGMSRRSRGSKPRLVAPVSGSAGRFGERTLTKNQRNEVIEIVLPDRESVTAGVDVPDVRHTVTGHSHVPNRVNVSSKGLSALIFSTMATNSGSKKFLPILFHHFRFRSLSSSNRIISRYESHAASSTAPALY